VVAERADAAQHRAGLDPGRVIHGKAVEDVHTNVLQIGGQSLQHGPALAQTEQRVLVRIAQDRHDQFVKNLAATFNQIQVPVGRWIKRAGIDGDDLFQASSLFLTENRQAWLKEDSMRRGRGIAIILGSVAGSISPPGTLSYTKGRILNGFLRVTSCPWWL